MRSAHLLRFGILALAAAVAEPAWPASIYKLTVDDIIHRVSAQYIVEGIERAEKGDGGLVLLQLKTPGGLDASMREIIEKILNSKVPVVVYVAPSGARAASAGFLITIAADVAAMAPGTNMGAATPVSGTGQQMDETLAKKVRSDAAAYIRSIAAKRGRNVDLAEKGVLEAQSWTENEALEANLIDLVAADQTELLEKLDGMTVTRFDGSEVLLETSGKPLVEIEMRWGQRVLGVISHPNVAYILMALGLLGLYFELANPGAILPGVIGVISLILAFLALQVLPVNYAGLLLMLVGIGLLVAEALTPSFGVLGLGGVVGILLGSLVLFEEQSLPTPALRVSWGVILPVVVSLTVMLGLIGRLVVIAQRRRATTGYEGLIGTEGIAKTAIDEEGKVFLHGELWDARAREKIPDGDRVRVTGVRGLVLDVERISKTSPEGE
ncbi:MAG: nodulation protein NfeD [Acidobacteriota bacterium]